MAGSDKEVTDPLVLMGRQLLARYTIQERIAHGGMSVVYRGLDERLQRAVCVKVFFGLDPTQAVYQTSYEHFVQEAFALSQLQHPNVIRIYDFGYLDEEPKSPFHVSEFMNGGTLRQHVHRLGRLGLRDSIAILEPLVGALAEAHGRGIVHRDIKPTNILFGHAGTRQIVKLADFGIAKAHISDEERGLPHQAGDTQAIAGRRVSLFSPGWASPEQLRGQKVGPTSDVFALGLVTVFMLTGKKLFSDKNVHRTIEDRSKGDAYIDHTLELLDLRESVASVIRRACRVDPDARFQSVDDLLTELRKLRGSQHDDTGSDVLTDRVRRMESEPDFTPLRALNSEPVALAEPARTEPPRAEPPRAEPRAEPRSEPRTKPPPLPLEVLAAAPGLPVIGDELVPVNLSADEILASGRAVRLVRADDHVDLTSGDKSQPSRARFRVTLLPAARGRQRLHVKGLNCFVAKRGMRPSSGIDVDDDTSIELLSPERKRIGTVRCDFGHPSSEARLFPVGSTTLAVPAAGSRRAAMLDLGPDSDLILVYLPTAAPMKRSRL